MPDTASLVSAVAAAIAALLAGLNLYYTGRREQRRWARDILVDLLVEYLDASFQATTAAKHIYERGDHKHDPSPDQSEQAAIQKAHNTQMAMLTRLRLLSSKSMADAAIALHGADHRFVELVAGTPRPTPAEVTAAKEDVWQARRRFFISGKRAVGLRAVVGDEIHSPFSGLRS